MSTTYISTGLRKLVTEQAQHRCGYCLRTEELLGMPLTLDHLMPESAGGVTAEENLWLACPRCNQFKGSQTHAHDPKTGEWVALFNPRLQKWTVHFEWSADGIYIQGKTACGRTTILALQMNNPEIVVTRRQWVSVGWWPPSD